jgi:hypothetical protein
VYLPDRGTGFYDGFEPLNNEDIKEIKTQINIVLQEEKYSEKNRVYKLIFNDLLPALQSKSQH